MVFLILAGCFQGVYVRVLEPNRVLRDWCMIVHLVSAAIVFVLTTVACMIDPADKGKDDEDGLPGNYCALCRLVVHKDSKHCRACDKVLNAMSCACVSYASVHSALKGVYRSIIEVMLIVSQTSLTALICFFQYDSINAS